LLWGKGNCCSTIGIGKGVFLRLELGKKIKDRWKRKNELRKGGKGADLEERGAKRNNAKTNCSG